MMEERPHRVAIAAWVLAAALPASSLTAQEHHHEPTQEELARLNAEWDR